MARNKTQRDKGPRETIADYLLRGGTIRQLPPPWDDEGVEKHRLEAMDAIDKLGNKVRSRRRFNRISRDKGRKVK